MTVITKDVVQRALPTNLKNNVTDALVDNLNNITTDPLIAEQIRNNFVSYTGVLKEGKFKIDDYLSAVAFVSYRLMGHTNKDAYFKTFPQRYLELKTRGASDKDISAYVSAYSKGKLVNLIMEQSLVPSWVLNQDIYQKAINVQASIMNDVDVCSRDRVAAANSLLTHLTKPKEAGPAINIDLRETSGVNELRDLLGRLATQQKEMIAGGASVIDIAASKIVEGEVVDGTD